MFVIVSDDDQEDTDADLNAMDIDDEGGASSGPTGRYLQSFSLITIDDGVPLMQCCGVLDVNGVGVSAQMKLNQALHGIYLPHTASQHSLLPTDFPSHLYKVSDQVQEQIPDLICVPHSTEPFANEYEIDHVYKAFPKVFPFGKGGFSDPGRSKKLSWEMQMKWMLEQSHGRFAEHEVFMFIVFNIIQRRKICLGAKLTTSRSNLPRVATLLRSMDYKSVQRVLTADKETGEINMLSDPALRQLMESTAIANGLVRGSREYIRNRRNEIRGLFARFGGPKFFITINPDDVRHPLILSLRGDISNRWRPTVTSEFAQYCRLRAKIVANNPVLQAQFFDSIFRAVIDVVFGFERESRIGIFGKVVAHYDIIESQGKGTLHAHGLIWTADGNLICSSSESDGIEINPKELQGLLQDEAFRARLTTYLESIVKMDFEWSKEPDESTVYGQGKENHAAYQFPDYYSPMMRGSEATEELRWASRNSASDIEAWTQAFEYDAKAIAITTQTHTHTATCRKKGTACRFGFAGRGKPLCQATTIDPLSGEIEVKRGNAMVNNHNPLIAAVTRSNHDIKPTFLSGYKSLQSMYYMTAYVSKFEDDISDSVIMESAWKGLE